MRRPGFLAGTNYWFGGAGGSVMFNPQPEPPARFQPPSRRGGLRVGRGGVGRGGGGHVMFNPQPEPPGMFRPAEFRPAEF